MASPAHRHRRKPKAGRPSEPAIGGHGRPQISRIEIACWTVLFAAGVGALIWNHCTHFFYSWTDEQIHFYVAHRMAEGAVLYRDIDSARPPLVVFPITWLIRMGCSPLLAGRAMVLGIQLATAGLLLWGGWHLASRRAGAVAALLFLTSPEVFSRIHYTGIQLVALTVSACVLFSLRAQPLRAGLFFGLSLAADQHGLVVCGIVALLTVVRRPRDAFPFAMGALIICAIVFGGVWAMGGRHLWESLVGIHLHHLRVGQGVGAQFWEKFTPWHYEHGYLFVGAGLAIVLLGLRRAEVGSGDPRPPSSRVVRVLLLVVGAHIAVVLAMAEAVFLYVVVIAPMLTLLAGIGFDATVAWWRQRSQLTQVRAPRASRLMLGGAVAVAALTAGGWAAARSHREGLDDRHYSFWPHVLHGQVERLQQLDVALRGISESMLPKDGTIFGDPTIVTALALHSGRRVSGELADLNPGWIEAGTVRREEVVSRIERDGVAAVITPPWGLVQDPYFKSYLFSCYEKPKPFFPPQSGPGEGLAPFILVFTHLDSTTPCQVPPP
jgi:hypothetical protein